MCDEEDGVRRRSRHTTATMYSEDNDASMARDKNDPQSVLTIHILTSPAGDMLHN
jgi:hypothetical protein